MQPAERVHPGVTAGSWSAIGATGSSSASLGSSACATPSTMRVVSVPARFASTTIVMPSPSYREMYDWKPCHEPLW